MQQLSRTTQLTLAAIIVAFALVALLYGRSVPIFEHSDEAEHTLFIHHLLERQALPVIQSGAQMAAQEDLTLRWNNQSHHAPLYYLLGAALVSWTERDDITDYLRANELIFLRDTTANNPNKWLHDPAPPTGDTHTAVYALRLFSIALGCVTLWLVHRAARYIFTDAHGPLLTTAFVAALPTFIVVNSGVSNDALTILLYTAGILWTLRVYTRQTLRLPDAILLSIIVSGLALTKLTGLSLLGLVAAMLALGIQRRYWPALQALRTLLLVGVLLALLGGWWYLRNWQFYGDPLALAATASIWGRTDPLTLSSFVENIRRIAQSFWLLIGYLHQPVYAPQPVYIYCAAITALAVLGGVRFLFGASSTEKRTPSRDILGLLVVATGLVIAILLWGTRSVDISYGRLLLPAIVAIAALFVVGWRALLGRFALLLLLPMIALAIATPLIVVPLAYPTLERVALVPDHALPIGATAETLEVVALDIHNADVIHPGDTLQLDLYLRGNHQGNPALLVTVADSLRATRLGHIEVYPGMAATDSLDAAALYRVPLRVPLDVLPDAVREPRLTTILFKFVDLEDNRTLLFDTGEALVEVFGPTLHDRRYDPPDQATQIDVRFGDAIALQGYTTPDTITRAEPLQVQFNWQALRPLQADWTLTLRLVDDADNIVAQTDEMPYWYPTSAWVDGLVVSDSRTLDLPADLSAGDYRLQLGWYRTHSDGSFEPLFVAGSESALYMLEARFTLP